MPPGQYGVPFESSTKSAPVAQQPPSYTPANAPSEDIVTNLRTHKLCFARAFSGKCTARAAGIASGSYWQDQEEKGSHSYSYWVVWCTQHSARSDGPPGVPCVIVVRVPGLDGACHLRICHPSFVWWRVLSLSLISLLACEDKIRSHPSTVAHMTKPEPSDNIGQIKLTFATVAYAANVKAY